MEIFRLEKLLFRQQSTPLYSLLAPSVAPWPSIRNLCPRTPHPKSFLNLAHARHLSQQSRIAQQAAAPTSDPSLEDGRWKQSSTPNPQSQQRRVNTLFDDLLAPTNRPNSRTQTSNPSQSGSSVTDLEDAFGSSITKRGPTAQSEQRRAVDVDRMADPPRGSTSQPRSTDIDGPPMPQKLDQPPMRLGPRVGRSIDIDSKKDIDPAKGFRQLDMLCGRNRIRADFMKQRFHERAGLKRKRLKRERWRKRFKVAFQATVSRVQELRRKGW